MHKGLKISKPVNIQLFDELEEAHREAGWLATWLLSGHGEDTKVDAYRTVILDAVALGISRTGLGERFNELDAAGMVALIAIDAIGTVENRPFIDALIAIVDAAKAYAKDDAAGFRTHIDLFATHKAAIDAQAEPRRAKARAASKAEKEVAPEVVAAPA